MARRASTIVMLGVTATLAATLTGCSSGPDYQGVCVDKTTGVRIDDLECEAAQPRNSYVPAWYFIGAGRSFPPVGTQVSGGSWSTPAGASALKGGASTVGGTVTRGGFGSHFGGGVGG